MASNLSTIGFDFIDEEAFLSTMNKLAQEASPQPNAPSYSLWQDASGAQIWFHVKPDTNEPVGLTPFFSGPTKTQLTIQKTLRHEADTAYEGLVIAAPETSEPEGELAYPLVFECPDFAALPEGFTVSAEVQLTVFAGSLKTYSDEADFAANQDPDASFSAKSFVPLGLIAAEQGEQIATSNAHTMVTGTITAVTQCTNSETKAEFISLTVESDRLTFDVAADPTVVDGPVEVGRIIDITGTLFGRVLG